MSRDKKVIRVVEEIKKAGVKVLRVEIIQLHHNVLVAGYREKWKITELVTRNYWWPGVTKDVGKYMEGYNMC